MCRANRVAMAGRYPKRTPKTTQKKVLAVTTKRAWYLRPVKEEAHKPTALHDRDSQCLDLGIQLASLLMCLAWAKRDAGSEPGNRSKVAFGPCCRMIEQSWVAGKGWGEEALRS